MKIPKATLNGALVTLGFLTTSAAFAGGLIVYEIGTPDLGLASAGYAARAQDAATAVTNPAGMTRLAKTELMLGVQPLYGNLEFSPNTSTTVPGNDGGNAVGWFPGGGAYYVYSSTPRLKYGLSAYGNFGLSAEYDAGWVGRYHVEKSTLLDLTLAPSIAYRLNERWSLGAALNVVYGILSTTVAVNNNPLGFFNTPDGEFKLKNETWSFGGTFGVLYELDACTRFGMTYNTETELNFATKIAFSDTLPAIIPGGSFKTPIDLGMTVPQSIMASFFHQIDREWAIMGNLGWQNWSEFGRIEVEIGSAHPTSVTTNFNYKDTGHIALGAQYTISKFWRFSFGAAFDSSMISSAERTVALPVGPAWRLGLGAQYFMNKNFDLGLGYTLVWSGDLDVDQKGGILTGRLAGSFNNAAIQYFGLNLHWKC